MSCDKRTLIFNIQGEGDMHDMSLRNDTVYVEQHCLLNWMDEKLAVAGQNIKKSTRQKTLKTADQSFLQFAFRTIQPADER